VDDLGNPLSSGQLEVSDTELVLHQRGKQPTQWPIKSLRRYGYDSQVFSFEAGRRCPTGSGIYAFSCHRAEQLFNCVQAKVFYISKLIYNNSYVSNTNYICFFVCF
jgi:fibroblast growth factor receptor substrate 2